MPIPLVEVVVESVVTGPGVVTGLVARTGQVEVMVSVAVTE